MRKFVLALCAIAAFGVSLPLTNSAQAEQQGMYNERDHDRGMHRGYVRGHHYGWERNRRHYGWEHNRRHSRVVVIKRSRHYGND